MSTTYADAAGRRAPGTARGAAPPNPWPRTPAPRGPRAVDGTRTTALAAARPLPGGTPGDGGAHALYGVACMRGVPVGLPMTLGDLLAGYLPGAPLAEVAGHVHTLLSRGVLTAGAKPGELVVFLTARPDLLRDQWNAYVWGSGLFSEYDGS